MSIVARWRDQRLVLRLADYPTALHAYELLRHMGMPMNVQPVRLPDRVSIAPTSQLVESDEIEFVEVRAAALERHIPTAEELEDLETEALDIIEGL